MDVYEFPGKKQGRPTIIGEELDKQVKDRGCYNKHSCCDRDW